MTALAEFDTTGHWQETHVCEGSVRMALRRHGLDFGRWEARPPHDIDLDGVRAAYAGSALTLRVDFPIRGVERLGPHRQKSQWRSVRRRLSVERTHTSPEIQHFLGGFGLLYLRHARGYLGLLCEPGDWVWLDAGTPYRVALSDSKDLDLLRLVEHAPAGQGETTGIADPQLPSLDHFVEHLLGLVGQEVD